MQTTHTLWSVAKLEAPSAPPILVALSLFCSVSFGETSARSALEGISSAGLERLELITSLDYTTNSQIVLRGGDASKPYITRKVRYLEEGGRFAFEFESSGDGENRTRKVKAAFDGQYYGVPQNTRLLLSSTVPEHIPELIHTAALTMPYHFLAVARSGAKDSGAKFMRVSDLTSPEVWKAFVRDANVKVGNPGSAEQRIISFAGRYFGKDVNVSVWLPAEEEAFPMKWQLRAEDKSGFEYLVTKVGAIEVGGSEIRYPAEATLLQYTKGAVEPTARNSIHIENISINGKVDDSVFSFDPAMFNVVYDVAEKKTIRVPK